MNVFYVAARSIFRMTGLVSLIERMSPPTAYEKRFHEELVKAVKPGDVVWDVGANVGLYTEQFCRWVGERGSVVAFEPGVEACESIRERIPNCAWLKLENVALGETDMAGRLVIEGSSVDNHIKTAGNPAEDSVNTIPVTICRGDTVRDRLGQMPDIVKVDVEGFEEEVSAGFGDMLATPKLRGLFVEVHFNKLARRGRTFAPVRIEKLLRSNGFTTKWADRSHIVATRSSSSPASGLAA